jgi:hypothetical protein
MTRISFFVRHSCSIWNDSIVSQPANPESATHPDIQEILRKRREMLNRVRADLDRIDKLQQDFRQADPTPKPDPKNPAE